MQEQLDFFKSNIYRISHQGQFIGVVNSLKSPIFFESHPKDLIRAVGGGFGVVDALLLHPQIQLYKFIYKNKTYSITKENF